MIEILFAANLLLLGFFYRLLNEKIGRIIAAFFAVYLGAFILLKPALSYYADIYYPFSTNAPAAVSRLLIGSLIFLAVQLWGIRFFTDTPPAGWAMRWFDFDRASPRGIAIAFLVLMAISFVGAVVKFGSPTYLFSYADTFAATMALSNGSFFLNIVAEILVYGMLMLVGYTYWRYPPWRSFVILMLVLLLTFVWTKLANRTTILVAILAWASCVMSFRQQNRIGLIRFGLLGYVLLAILYVANYFRLGLISHVQLSDVALGAVTGAAADLVPVDCALLLYSNMPVQNLTWFAYVAGAITPLALVPSALIPFKPRLDKDSTLTDMFFPHGADTSFFHEGSTLTFTVPASGYADAWFFGTLVASLLYVLVVCFYIRIYRYGSRSARFVAAFWLMIVIAAYRLSIETVLMNFYTCLCFVGLTRLIALAASDAPTSARPAPAVS